MKNLGAILLVAALASNASAIDWLNGTFNQDFADPLNWDPNAVFDGTETFSVNKLGPFENAILSSDLPSRMENLRVGSGGLGGDGELHITGGDHVVGNATDSNGSFVAGSGGDSATVVISGGTLSVPYAFNTIGDGGNATVEMSGGTWNGDRITWGQQSGFTSTLNMTGGEINLTSSDPTPPGTSTGRIVQWDGDSVLNIGGTSVVNVLGLRSRGTGNQLINLTGGELNIGTQANGPFLIEGTAASYVIDMTGGIFTVENDETITVDALIADGTLTTSLPLSKLVSSYDVASNLTNISIMQVPEPASLALLAFGVIGMVAGRRSSR